MHSNTVAAVRKLAAEFDVHVQINDCGDSVVVLDGDPAEVDYVTKIAEVHLVDAGRWISASYDERNLNWQSSDLPSGDHGASAPHLAALADWVNVYPSAAKALRPSLEAYRGH